MKESCEKTKELLADGRAHEVFSHLRLCPECSRVAEVMRELDDDLAALPRHSPQSALSEQVIASLTELAHPRELHAPVREKEVVVRSHVRRVSPAWYAALAAAALVTLVLRLEPEPAIQNTVFRLFEDSSVALFQLAAAIAGVLALFSSLKSRLTLSILCLATALFPLLLEVFRWR